MHKLYLIIVVFFLAACGSNVDKTTEAKKAIIATPYVEKIPDMDAEKVQLRKHRLSDQTTK